MSVLHAANLFSVIEQQFKKEEDWHSDNCLSICAELRRAVNTQVDMTDDQIQILSEAIHAYGWKGKRDTPDLKPHIIQLADFVNSCRG